MFQYWQYLKSGVCSWKMLKRKQQQNIFLQSNNLNLQSCLRGFVGEEGGIFLGYSIDMNSTYSKF
jgi:hypothetical protein